MPVICIVEDSPMDQKFLTDSVKGISSRQHVTACVEDGMQMMQCNCCNVLLLDLILPNGQGIMVLNNFRSAFPEIPIVVITGDTSIDKRDLLAAGATEVMYKPVKEADVKDAVIWAIARNKYTMKNRGVKSAVQEVKQELAREKQKAGA